MDTTVDDLADELAVDPDDIRVVLREHDVFADDLSDANAWDVRLALDPGGERSWHNSPPERWYGLGSPHSPTGPY